MKTEHPSASFFRPQPGVPDDDDAGVSPLFARPGLVLDGFELVRVLGRGAMGEVWEARQLEIDGRHVAFKLIRAGRATESSLRAFEREARAGGRLNHPCTITVYTVGRFGDTPWIAQELVEGSCTLADFLRDLRAGRAEVGRDYARRVAAFIARTAEGLGEAHAKGVIHMDVKPGNILITQDDMPKVGDFGLALLVDDEANSSLLHAGTPQYMSPEQADVSASGLDHRTDVFSLGCVLYELLTLAPPFQGKDVSEVLRHIVHDTPTPPHERRHGVPVELSVICMKALEKRPDDRFASMAELTDELERFLNLEPIRTRPPHALARARKWSRRHPTASVALLLALLGAGVASVLVADRASVEHERDREAYRRHLLLADVALEGGDLDSARASVAAALELQPDSADAHLVLASGYSQYGLLPQAKEELDLAIAAGFSTDPARVLTPEDAYFYGLYLLIEGRQPRYDDALRYLTDAVTRDPGLHRAYYPLYRLRYELHDFAGARDALIAFQRGLRIGDAYARIVLALRHELEGQPREALRVLEQLAAEPSAGDEPIRHGLHRILGRLYLRVHDDARAYEHLTRAIEVAPEASSWMNLATLHLRQEKAELDEAEHCARAVLELNPYRREAHQVLAHVAVVRLYLACEERTDDATLWSTAETAVEELTGSDPTDRFALELTGELEFLHGKAAYGEGDDTAARQRFEEALRLNPDHVAARIFLAELWFERGAFPQALEQLDRARASWPAANEIVRAGPVMRFQRDWAARLLHRIEVWRYRTAIELDDRAVAAEALAFLRTRIASDEFTDPTQLLNFAEYLPRPTDPALRDCDLARAIADAITLKGNFAGNPDAEAMLDEIARQCP